MRLHNDCLSHWQLAVVLVPQVSLKPCLQLPTEAMQINEIYPTVHLTETVGRAYYCISGYFKNISVRDSHVGNANEVFLPGSDHVGIYVAQFKEDRFHGPIKARRLPLPYLSAPCLTQRSACGRLLRKSVCGLIDSTTDRISSCSLYFDEIPVRDRSLAGIAFCVPSGSQPPKYFCNKIGTDRSSALPRQLCPESEGQPMRRTALRIRPRRPNQHHF